MVLYCSIKHYSDPRDIKHNIINFENITFQLTELCNKMVQI